MREEKPLKNAILLSKTGEKRNLTRCLQLTNTISQVINNNFHLTTSYFYDENSILRPLSKFQKFDSIALYIINFCSVQWRETNAFKGLPSITRKSPPRAPTTVATFVNFWLKSLLWSTFLKKSTILFTKIVRNQLTSFDLAAKKISWQFLKSTSKSY